MLGWITERLLGPILDAFRPTPPSVLSVENLINVSGLCKAFSEFLAAGDHSESPHKRNEQDRFIAQLKSSCVPLKNEQADARVLRAVSTLESHIQALESQEPRIESKGPSSAQQRISKDLSDIARTFLALSQRNMRKRRTILVFGAVFIGGSALYFLLPPFLLPARIRKARKEVLEQSVKRIDPPYASEIHKNRISPSKAKNVVDRTFQITTLGETPNGLPLSQPRNIESVEAARIEIENLIQDGSPLLVITGRIGTGIGYVTAHLFSRIVEEAIRASPEAPAVAGRERWLFHFKDSELFPKSMLQSDAKNIPIDPKRVLLEGARRALETSQGEASDGDILRFSVVIVEITQHRDFRDYVSSLVAFAKDWNACIVLAPPLDMLARWRKQDLRIGHRLELLPYASTEATRKRVARAAIRQALGTAPIDDEVFEQAVTTLLADKYAPELVTYNWRIGRFYLPKWIRKMNYLKTLHPLENNESTELARATLIEAIAAHGTGWVAEFYGKDDVSRRLRGEAFVQLIGYSLMASTLSRSFGDEDFNAYVTSTPFASKYQTRDLSVDDLELLRLLVQGSPFFRSNDFGDLAWIPFSNHGPTLLGAKASDSAGWQLSSPLRGGVRSHV